MGAWISYGLGSENKDLPAFVVMISHGRRESDRLCPTGCGAADFCPPNIRA